MPDNAHVSDRALLDRLLAGDPRAADTFVVRFTPLVWWILFHRLRLTPESAEEVYQEVFLHLWEDDYRRLRLWSGDGDLAAYLAPIVRHRGLDWLRARQKSPSTDQDPDRADDGPSPEDQALLDEQRRLLDRVVATLAGHDRRLFDLRYVEERSYRQIAKALDITVNNVGVRVSRLVERLRAALADPGPPTTPQSRGDVRSPGARPSIK